MLANKAGFFVSLMLKCIVESICGVKIGEIEVILDQFYAFSAWRSKKSFSASECFKIPSQNFDLK